MADANSDRILKILLQLQADTSGAAQTTTALKQVQAQATETAAAVNAAKAGTTEGAATSGALVDWNALAAQRAQTMQQINALTKEEAGAAQASAAAQALINAQMERRVIMETEIEAAEAKLAGDPGMAAKLEREAAIRTRAVAIQRTLNISTEEAIALAERLAIANEMSVAPTARAGANLAKAKQEAIVLAREMGTGTVRASTLSSLLGSLGSTLTIAGIAAYSIYQGIKSATDESLKLTRDVAGLQGDIAKAVDETIELARRSENVGDSIRIADKWSVELSQVQVQMAQFRAKELGFWASFVDKIVNMFATAMNAMFSKIPGLEGIHLDTRGPFQREAEADVAKAEVAAKQALTDANAALDISVRSRSEWAKAMADPGNGLAFYTQKVTELQSKLATIDRSTPAGFKAYAETLHELDDANSKLDQLGNQWDKNNKKAKEHAGTNHEISATLREQAGLMAQIRGNQQIVQQNPFLSADQKEAALIPLITQEITAMNAQLARDIELRDRATDPAQWEQMNTKIIQARTEVTLLGQKLQTLSFGGGLRAELTSWANQFGTTAKQVAGIITNTLGTAISSTSQAITSLIFKTGNWKQAFAQAAQSIVQNIIQIALQWIVSRTLMAALNKLFGQTDSAAASAQAATASAAWAPAAVSASIASYGAASGVGLAAYLSALAAGEAGAGVGSAVGGGLAGGGRVPGSPSTRDNMLIPMASGEHVINSTATQWADHTFGSSFLDSINQMRVPVARGLAGGGRVGSITTSSSSQSSSGESEIHIFNYTDRDELRKAILASDAGRKIIVDTVRDRRAHLGIKS